MITWTKDLTTSIKANLNAYNLLKVATEEDAEEKVVATLVQSGYNRELANEAVASAMVAKEKNKHIALTKADIAVTTAAAKAHKLKNAVLKIGAIGLTTLATAGIAYIGTKIVEHIYEQKQAQEKLIEATRQASEEHANEKKSLEDNIIKYEELHQALKEAKGDEEETYKIKKQLLDLQNELNDLYGDECGEVDLVTDSYRSQLDVIKKLNKEKAKNFLKDNKEGIENAKDEMLKKNEFILGIGIQDNVLEENDLGEQIHKIINEEFSNKGIKVGALGDIEISVNASNVEQADEIVDSFVARISNLQNEFPNNPLISNIVESSKTALEKIEEYAEDEAKEIQDEFGSTFNEALLAQIEVDGKLSSEFDKATNAVDEYNEAVLKSNDAYNDENVISAYNNLKNIKEEFENSKDWTGEYSSVTSNIFNNVNTSVLEFREALIDGNSELSWAINQIKDMEGIDFMSLAATSTESLNDQLKEAIERRKELYGSYKYEGNVDVANRPVITNDDRTYSTTSTQFQEGWYGDEKNGGYRIIHYTPILPNGEILDENSLNEYIDKALNHYDPLVFDNPKNGGKGIIYQVTTEVNGEKITDGNLDKAFVFADVFSQKMHNLQDKMYGSEGSLKLDIETKPAVDEIIKLALSLGVAEDSIADLLIDWGILKGVVSDANGTEGIAFLDAFKVLPTKELENFLSLVESEELTADNIGSYKELNKILLETGSSSESALEKLKEFAEGYESTVDLTNSIQTSYEALEKIKQEFAETKIISLDSLNAIVEKFPELTYATTAYTQGLMSAHDLMDLLEQAYIKDAEAYQMATALKLQTDNEFFIKVYNANQTYFENLAKAYGLDVENWKDMAQAKAEIEQKLIQNCAAAWSKYYKIQIDANTGLANMVSTTKQGNGKDYYRLTPEETEAMNAAYNAAKNYNDIVNSLNNIAADAVILPDFGGISNIDGNGGGGGSDSKDDYKETFDFFERRVEVLNQAFEGLSASMENVLGSNAKNSILSSQIGILTEETKNYTDALAMYSLQADKSLSGLDETIIYKIKNGVIELTDFTGENGEKVVKAMEAYKGWANKVKECQTHLEELKKEIAQLELTKFNNIADEYANRFDLYGNSIDLIDKQIGLFEEAGQLVGESFYEAQIDLVGNQLSTINEERQRLAHQMAESLASGNIEKGSEEWLEMVKTLSDLEGQAVDAKTQIEELENAILQIEWDTFDRIQTQFGNLNSELENLVGLFDDFNEVNVSDGEGTWTDEAIASLGVYAQQYEMAKYRVEQYTEAIEKLKKDYANGKYSATEYAEKLAELTNGQWDAVNSAEAMEDAIMDLNRTRVDEEIEVINEAIEAYNEYTESQKEALEAARDLHEYEKSIAEKTKAIADIEKQLAAIQNDNSAATIAKRKQLEEELAEAKKDLEETEYDHSIDTQIDALDKNYESYEEKRNAEIEVLEESLKDREAIISQSFETVKTNSDLIGQEIEEIAKEHGVKISETLTDSWKSGENAIASYGQALSSGTSAFVADLMVVEQKEWDLQEQANRTSESLAAMFSNKAEGLIIEFNTATSSIEDMNEAIIAVQNNLINLLENGFDTSGLVGSLEEVKSAANSASKAVSSIGSGFSGGGSNYSNDDEDESDSSSKLTEYDKKKAENRYLNTYEIIDKDGKILVSAIKTPEKALELQKQLYTANDIDTDIQYRSINNKTRIVDLVQFKRYAKGGIVGDKEKKSVLDALAQNVGEDRMIAVQDGEGILTKEQTQAFLKLTPILTNDKFAWLKNTTLPSGLNSPQNNATYQYGSLVTVNGNIDDTNLTKMTEIVRKELKNTFSKIDRDHRYSGY